MKKSDDMLQEDSKRRGPFEENVSTLFQELELAVKWDRPSILLAVCASQWIREKAELALEQRLMSLNQRIYHLKLDEKQFNVPLMLSKIPYHNDKVFYIAGLGRGGGRGDFNTYRSLNLHREYFVDNRIRAVFWLTRKEMGDLSIHAPDFWAFRHRVVEFIQHSAPKYTGFLPERFAWRPWQFHEDINTKIALRKKMLAELPNENESETSRAELLQTLASLYRANGQIRESIDILKEGLDIVQRLQMPVLQSELWVDLGIIYHNLGQLDEALGAYQKALGFNSENGAAWNNLGHLYHDLGQHNNAIAACKKAIKLDPGSSDPWNNLGIVYHRLGRNDEALHAFQQAISLRPNDARPWNNLGNVYFSLDRSEDAIDAYQKAIGLDARDARPWSNLGNIYFNRNRDDDALHAYEKAIELASKDAGPWNNIGRLYYTMGRIGDSIAAYKRAIELDPENSIFHISLAACYRKFGRNGEAEQQITIAQSMIKNESEYTKACFESARGNVDKALALLGIALKKKQISVDWIRRDLNLDFVRYDPRFSALVGEA